MRGVDVACCARAQARPARHKRPSHAAPFALEPRCCCVPKARRHALPDALHSPETSVALEWAEWGGLCSSVALSLCASIESRAESASEPLAARRSSSLLPPLFGVGLAAPRTRARAGASWVVPCIAPRRASGSGEARGGRLGGLKERDGGAAQKNTPKKQRPRRQPWAAKPHRGRHSF